MTELSDADDAAVDGFPNFFEWGGSVYAYWSIGKFPPPAGYKHDYRQAVQLVERDSGSLAQVRATLGVEEPAANGTARVWATVTEPAAGPAATAPMVRTADGSLVAMQRVGDRWTGLVDASQLAGGEPVVSLCGKDVETIRDDGVVPAGAAVTPATPLGAPVAVAALLAATGVAALASATRRRKDD